MQPNSCCMMTLGNITQEPCCQNNCAIHVHNLSCMMRWVAICSFPSLAVEINRTTNYHQTIRLRKHRRSLITPAFEWNNDCINMCKSMIGDRTHQIHKVFNVHRQATKANAAQSLNKGSKTQLCFTIPCFCRIQVLLQRVALTKIGKETQLLPAAVQQWWWSTSSPQS